MRRLTILLVLVMLIPMLADAAEIYGTIRKGSKSLGSGVPVEIRIGNKLYSTKTDKYGSYSLYVVETGKCTLTIRGTKSSPSIEVRSYKSSARYDLVLYRKDNTWRLKRK